MSTVRIQLRRGLEADWTSADTALNATGGLILAAGEVGLESDTGKFKFGDGSTRWSTLGYALANTLTDYVLLAEVGQPNGVASLNSSGKVPSNQLDISELSQDAVNTALVAGTGLSKIYDDNANTITLSLNATTTNVSEGTNLYFTDERAQDAVNTAIVAGTNISKSYDDNANTITISMPNDIILSGYVDANEIIGNSATIDGALTAGSVTISGDLVVNGTYSTVPSTSLTVENPMIYLAEANPANSLDIGLVGSHTISGTYSHTGLVKDATDGIWKLFSGITSEPGSTVDFTTWTKDNLQVGDMYTNQLYIGNVEVGTEINLLSGATGNIQDQLDDRVLTTTANSTYAPINHPTLTGTVTLPSTTTIGDVGAVEIGYLNGVTSSIQNQLDLKLPAATAATIYAPLEAPTFTGGVVLPSTTTIGDISGTELGYLNGVTSAIQTQLDQKTTDLSNHELDTTSVHGIADTADLATKTYADTAVSTHNSDTTSVHGIADTAALATKTYADDAVSTHSSDTTSVHGIADTAALATKTYADGKASDAQTAAQNYADSAVSTHNSDTTSVHGISDTSKVVLTNAASTTLDGALIVSGDFTVNGTNFSASATSITIEDNMVQLAHQNPANTVDLGLVVAYNDGAAKHAGIVRDVSDAKWKLFKGVTSEPSTTVDFTQGSLDDLAVNNLTAAGIVFTDGTQSKQGVPSITTISQKTAAYTLSSLTERDTLIEVSHTGGTAVDITVPLDSSVNYPVGTSIDILRTNTGGVRVVGAAGVTVNSTPGSYLRARWSSATLLKRAADTWVLIGDLATA